MINILIQLLPYTILFIYLSEINPQVFFIIWILILTYIVLSITCCIPLVILKIIYILVDFSNLDSLD